MKKRSPVVLIEECAEHLMNVAIRKSPIVCRSCGLALSNGRTRPLLALRHGLRAGTCVSDSGYPATPRRPVDDRAQIWLDGGCCSASELLFPGHRKRHAHTNDAPGPRRGNAPDCNIRSRGSTTTFLHHFCQPLHEPRTASLTIYQAMTWSRRRPRLSRETLQPCVDEVKRQSKQLTDAATSLTDSREPILALSAQCVHSVAVVLVLGPQSAVEGATRDLHNHQSLVDAIILGVRQPPNQASHDHLGSGKNTPCA